MPRVRALFIGTILLAGCASTPKELRDPTIPLSTYEVPFHVSMLDAFDMVMPDGTHETVTVDQDGAVYGPSGPLKIDGLTGEQAVAKIRGAFPGAARVSIREFRGNRVTVLGEVFHQIHTDLGDSPMRLMDAIAAANGFTPLANKRRVRLLRENAGRVEVYEFDLRDMMRGAVLQQNFLLEPGDVITVPKNFL